MEPECHAAKHDGPMECTVGRCTNREDQGNGLYLHVVDKSFGALGVEWICIPCWDALRHSTSNPQYSQVFRNMKDHFFSHSVHDVEKYYKDDYKGD